MIDENQRTHRLKTELTQGKTPRNQGWKCHENTNYKSKSRIENVNVFYYFNFQWYYNHHKIFKRQGVNLP